MTTAPRIEPYWDALDAAKTLGISRSELHQLLEKHGATWRDKQNHRHVHSQWQAYMRAEHRSTVIQPDSRGRGIVQHYTVIQINERGIALLRDLIDAADQEIA